MKLFSKYIFFFIPIVLFGQSKLDLTGRISMRAQNISYEEESKIKPDSIDSDNYSKTTLIPGLQQSMNLSLFGRMENFDFTLLSDIKNNNWNKLKFSQVNSIDRVSLNLRIYDHELIVGDFYQSNKERFIQSREIRGVKFSTKFINAFGKSTFINFEGIGGTTQKNINVGDRISSVYKLYETSGQYKRILNSAILGIGSVSLFDANFKYLHGEDKKSSIGEFFNAPLKNTLFGAESNLFILNKQVRIFTDYYSSQKDTIDQGTVNDFSMTGGFDLVLDKFNLLFMYQRIGFDYYTMGYPYLENDKEGIKTVLGYKFTNSFFINSDYERYENNLENDIYKPKNNTNILNTGITKLFTNFPEVTFNYGIRTDKSDVVLSQDSLDIKTDKITNKFELKFAYKINKSRFSLSTTFLKYDDKSDLGQNLSTDSTQISPLSTDQFISSFNFYSKVSQNLYFSGGIVFSNLNLSNNQNNRNFYIYETNRWDIIPRKLKFESTITAIINEARNGGIQDYLSDYFQLNAEISMEFFFNDFMSIKIITGTNSRDFKYNNNEALMVIENPDYGPTYFNGNESYVSWNFGGELNWNF